MKRAFVINSPFWLAGAWSGLRGILPDSVQVDILSKTNYLAVLKEYIDVDQIPREYGGSSAYSLGDHPFELELRKLVIQANEAVEGSDNEAVDVEAPPKEIRSPHVSHCISDPDLESSYSNMENKALYSATELLPLRRRQKSVDHIVVSRNENVGGWKRIKKVTFAGSEDDAFLLITLLHFLTSVSQGFLECSLPLWMSSSTLKGGSGYSPAGCGLSILSCTLLLLAAVRSRRAGASIAPLLHKPVRVFQCASATASVSLFCLGTISTLFV
jgi:hypothetical protein